MLGPIAWGREQGEQKIDGLIVNCAPRDRRIQSNENAGNPAETVDPRVRHCHAGPQPGRPQGLALHQRLQKPPFGQPERSRGHIGNHMQGLSLGRQTTTQNDGVVRQQVTDIHWDIPEPDRSPQRQDN